MATADQHVTKRGRCVGRRTAARPRDGATLRCIDIALSAVALIFLLPLLVVIAAAIFVFDPGPVLFAHRRVGRGGRSFDCYKFRSMAMNAPERLQELLAHDEHARWQWQLHHKLLDDPRVTGIGRVLRRSSMDELPQLFNVLLGTMSLVGPRPIVMSEVARYGRHFQTYCRVKPGLTGLWQISGRSNVSYRRRVVLDIAYVRSKSLALDLKILAYTIPSIIMVRGAY